MFIATTRFSLFLPNSKAWNVSRDGRSVQDYKNFLFDEKRLNFRIGFLKYVSLPLLEQASKNYSFLHLVEYSDNLPKSYIKQLKDLSDEYSFLRLNCYDSFGKPEQKMASIASDHFDLQDKNEDVFVGKFVLDDDDCLSLNYFEVMSNYLKEIYEQFYISIGAGAMGLYNQDYELIHCAHIYKPKINIGLMNVGRYDSSLQKLVFTTKGAPHMSMDKVNRVILDSRQCGFFWCRHDYQDTRLNKSESQIEKIINKIKITDEFSEEELETNFGDNFLKNLKRFSSDGTFDLG